MPKISIYWQLFFAFIMVGTCAELISAKPEPIRAATLEPDNSECHFVWQPALSYRISNAQADYMASMLRTCKGVKIFAAPYDLNRPLMIVWDYKQAVNAADSLNYRFLTK